jgi:ABC-type uncharacterized transport system ATPase subunit
MTDSILTIEHVSKSYTGHRALNDVSLDVPRGAVYGLLGPNGAGKSTLIRIINRITLADEGRVLLDGKPLTAEDVYHIGYMPEERGLYKKMRVGEQALFFARLKGLERREAERRLKAWFERLGIADWWGRNVEDLVRRHNVRILDIHDDFIVLEKTGHKAEIQELYQMLAPYGLYQFVCSGPVAIIKSRRELLDEYLDYVNERQKELE